MGTVTVLEVLPPCVPSPANPFQRFLNLRSERERIRLSSTVNTANGEALVIRGTMFPAMWKKLTNRKE
jgi:hypothetical protein